MATSAAYTTPTKRAAAIVSEAGAVAGAGPSRARPAGASPAYSSRRHSLYGIEDRVVIDPGSRIWKVGFSGEPDPRAVFWVKTDPSLSLSHSHGTDGSASKDEPSGEIWDLDPSSSKGVVDRSEGERLVGVRMMRNLKDAFVKHLMTDSKSRKVIILENTFMSTYIKEHIARILFDNLKVPSVSFTPSSLLALAACGRITGLVVDVGWLETSITPVYHSRPLYTLSRSTPIAGRRLHRRLHALLRLYGIYYAPPSSMSSVNERERIVGIPISILTDGFVERVLTEGCFAGAMRLPSQTPTDKEGDVEMQVDHNSIPVLEESMQEDEVTLEKLKRQYESTTTKDMIFKVAPREEDTKDMGPATIVVPGWIRERAPEILFEEDDEEMDIPRAVLGTLLKLPIDLRETMISNILVIGGTASLPGFIPRLRFSITQHEHPSTTNINKCTPTPTSAPLHTRARQAEETILWRKRNLQPYKDLYGLYSKLAILNDPAPLDGSPGTITNSKGGEAPRWTTGLMAWVGGSLAGALKTGGPEILRETYDSHISESISRGEIWRENQDDSENKVAAELGISIEVLRAGEALIDARPLIEDDQAEEDQSWIPRARRRGWRDSALVSDWSRVVKV